MKTNIMFLLLFVHMVAFAQTTSYHTSQSLKDIQNPEFLNSKKKHMLNHGISNKNIRGQEIPLNTEFHQLKAKTLEKIKLKEKFLNERYSILRESLLRSLNQEIFILDSLHVYSFSSPTDSLLTGRIFFTYNEAGENISFFTSELDTLSHLWQYLYKEDYYPDHLGRDTLLVYYNWDGEMNNWLPELKYEKHFDDFDNIISTARYYWEDSSQTWIGEYKTENAYDEFGNQTYYAVYTWHFTLSKWVGLMKNESEFDEQGNLTAWSDYYWDQELNIWRGSQKYINEVLIDENGVYQASIFFGWDEINNKWIGYSKHEYASDTSGKISYEASYFWNEITGSWEGDFKSEYFYQEDSQDYYIIYYTWNEATTDWIQNEKSEIHFDELTNNVNTRNYVWMELNNEWELFSKEVTVLNDSNLPVENIESSLKDSAVVVQLIKSFDSADDIINIMGDNSCEEKSCFSFEDEYIEGAGAVKWNYDVSGFEVWGGFSQIHLGNSLNMEGDDGILLFYKNLIPSAARFFIIFLESSGEEWRYENNFILADTATSWQQFVVPFENFFIPYFRTPVNGIFELDSIQSIQIQLFVPSGVSAMGTVSLDNFSTFKYEKTEEWIISSRQKLAYDMQGNLVSDSLYQWDDTLKALASGYYSLNTYDNNNNQTSHESYNWEYNVMDWIGSSKYEMSFNDQSYITSYLSYEWDYGSSDWVALQKTEKSYNEQNLETRFAIYYWDNYSGIWIGLSNEESVFDLSGNLLFREYHLWNYTENEWSPGYKTVWKYVDNQKLALQKNYEWDVEAGDWKVTETFYYHQMETVLNDRGLAEIDIFTQWNEDLAKWMPVRKYFYFYSEQTTDLRFPGWKDGKIAEIYPNPARDFVNIRLLSGSHGTASLVDFNGRIIKTEILSGSLNSIPLYDFTPGIYIIQVKTDHNLFTQKLVIQ